MLKQNLSQKLLQKLSPQQIQFIKLLQLNTTDFEQRLEEELMENPALESGRDDEAPETPDTANTTEEFEEESYSEDDQEFNSDDGLDISEYTSDYDEGDGFRLNEDQGDDDDRRESPIVYSTSFVDQLMEQIDVVVIDERELMLAHQLIGSIEEDGYLRRPLQAIVNDMAFSQNVDTTEEELEKVLLKIQKLDPPGIGARTLQECLLLQLQRKDEKKHPEVHLAIDIIRYHMDDFSKKHYEKLMKSMKISEDELRTAITLITKLNPKPGEAQAEGKSQYIIPDFTVHEEDGEFTVQLNSRNAPELRVSRSYMETLKGYEKNPHGNKHIKETVQFIKQKLDGAKWFIESVKQRQNTLLLTMNAIVRRQKGFFLSGDETDLRPMILKDIADDVGLDVSTISRVANSKYVETDFGIFQLKYFFSEGITTDDGEEVSNKEVKRILQECIESEDKSKPLPDEDLMEILKQKGYNIARRTVAKYREQMNIPVARLRKQL